MHKRRKHIYINTKQSVIRAINATRILLLLLPVEHKWKLWNINFSTFINSQNSVNFALFNYNLQFSRNRNWVSVNFLSPSPLIALFPFHWKPKSVNKLSVVTVSYQHPAVTTWEEFIIPIRLTNCPIDKLDTDECWRDSERKSSSSFRHKSCEKILTLLHIPLLPHNTNHHQIISRSGTCQWSNKSFSAVLALFLLGGCWWAFFSYNNNPRVPADEEQERLQLVAHYSSSTTCYAWSNVH